MPISIWLLCYIPIWSLSPVQKARLVWTWQPFCFLRMLSYRAKSVHFVSFHLNYVNNESVSLKPTYTNLLGTNMGCWEISSFRPWPLTLISRSKFAYFTFSAIAKNGLTQWLHTRYAGRLAYNNCLHVWLIPVWHLGVKIGRGQKVGQMSSISKKAICTTILNEISCRLRIWYAFLDLTYF